MTPRDRARVEAAVAEAALRRNLAAGSTVALARTARLLAASVPSPLRRLGRDDVRQFLAARARDLAPATLVHEASRVRVVLDLLAEARLVGPGLGRRARVTPAASPPQLLLSSAQVSALLAAAAQATLPRPDDPSGAAAALRDRATIELLYGTGLRAGEVGLLRVVDLDLARRALWLRAVKRGADRTVPLPARAEPWFRRYVDAARPVLVARAGRDPGRLLLTNRGTPLRARSVAAVVARAARRAGVRAHPHALRRALATHLVREGASVPVVAELLGHARLDTTAAYVVVERDDMRRAIELLDRDRR